MSASNTTDSCLTLLHQLGYIHKADKEDKESAGMSLIPSLTPSEVVLPVLETMSISKQTIQQKPSPSSTIKKTTQNYQQNHLRSLKVNELKKLSLAKGLSKFKKEDLIHQLLKRSSSSSMISPSPSPLPSLSSSPTSSKIEKTTQNYQQNHLRSLKVNELKKLSLAKGLSKLKKEDLIHQLVKRSKPKS